MTRLIHICVVLLAAAVGPNGWGLSCGDCNGDGQVQVTDVLRALQHDAGLIQLAFPELEACDVYPPGAPDQTISVLDGLLIARFNVGLVPTLGCVPPVGYLEESFDTQAAADLAETTADWGGAVAGSLTAGVDRTTALAFPTTTGTSSIPFSGTGRRMQLLIREADLQNAHGDLESIRFFLGSPEEAGRTYTDLEVRVAPTAASILSSSFDANYTGNPPVTVRSPATLTCPAGDIGDPFDLEITPAAFRHQGGNLLVEILHRGASAWTLLQVDTAARFPCRVHSQNPDADTGFVGNVSCVIELVFTGGYEDNTVGQSLFLDTGIVSPAYDLAVVTWDAPPGTFVSLLYEGAADNGQGQPDLMTATGWFNDPRVLSGHRYLRWRAVLHALPALTPQVDRIVIPYRP